MIIEGIVNHVKYRSPTSSYCVVVIDCEDAQVTATGSFPHVADGQNIELEGDFTTSKYGKQFAMTKIKLLPPSGTESIKKYLASGLIKGIGDATAKNIVDMFGENTLEIIEKEPSKLVKIRGISQAKAVEIANSYQRIKSMQESVMKLVSLGISTNMAVKIYENYKEITLRVIENNPYRLIEDIDGIGFSIADKISLNLGNESESDFRYRAGIIHVLKEFANNNGSTFLPKSMLFERTASLLYAEQFASRFEGIIEELANDRLVKVVDIESEKEECIALYQNYLLEKNICNQLLRLKKDYKNIVIDVDNDIKSFEKNRNIQLHEKQIHAIKSAINSGVVVITGGPGTGKTTIINCIASIFLNAGLRIELVAPTGRASKRLSELTNLNAKTIHRLLDLDFKNGKGNFSFNENSKLDCDAIIVDEMSMVDAFLMNSLLSALKRGTRIIMVGDKDQLSSIGCGNVLADILSSEMFETIYLSEIYRQSSESVIISNAHKINNGIMPELMNSNKDFFFSQCEGSDEIVDTTIELVTKRLPNFLKCEASEIQVLCPMKKGIVGSNNLNEKLQNVINPPSRNLVEKVIDQTRFRTNDKVMQMSNNYQMEWTLGNKKGLGVYNGDIGRITSIDNSNGEFHILFDDGKEARYLPTDTLDLSLAYSISIHKSQGSEFDIVVIPLSSGHRGLFTRNLLYTAVTRAKRLVVIVGSRSSIKAMVDNDYTEKRYSLLCDFLKS